MTIYYSLTFALLASEMLTFCLLVMPLPYAIRKRMFSFLSTSPIVAKLAYALKISFIFVGILFFDALQRMFRITAESEMAKSGSGGQHVGDIRTETNFAARKFYAQRNTYLTGFTLFLSLVLTRTFYITLDLIHVQEEYAKLKGTGSGSGKAIGNASDKDKDAQITELKRQLRDFETLKGQAKSQAAEYDRLAERYNKLAGEKGLDKKA